ncbi:MAG: class III poly(R)-hydroxyalkanoic acid synthase subunit PhaC [Steroidobacter sp.]
MPNTAREIEEFAQRLMRGVTALASVGDVTIGGTPKDEVYREDKLVMYRYRPFVEASGARRVRTPLLICYALVNRPYMMDLQPDRSLIRGLLQRGVDVYLIDWGYPDGADRYLGVEDYVLGYLPRCIDYVRQSTGDHQLNLLGVCQGGTLSLCYAALHPERIRNLITMVTPVDFRSPENLLTKWTQHIDVGALASTSGNVPGELLNALFLGLMPFRLTSQKYVDLLDHIDDPEALENFLRMEKWIFDSPDQPGEMFRQFVTWFVKENRLVTGGTRIGGRPVDLKAVTMPVLNIYARQDHLVPPSASKPLAGLVGTADYSDHEFQGGHIGIYVSGSAQREIPERIASWLRERDARR